MLTVLREKELNAASAAQVVEVKATAATQKQAAKAKKSK